MLSKFLTLVVTNLNVFLSYVEHTEDILNETVNGPHRIDFPTM